MEMGFTGASMEIGYGPRVGRGIDGRSRHRFDNGHIGRLFVAWASVFEDSQCYFHRFKRA